MLEQLKQTLDNHIGIPSELFQVHPDMAVLIYRSPSGVILFQLFLGQYDGRWTFDSKGESLPDEWKQLVKISKTYAKES